MAIVMIMNWQGVRPEQYDQARKLVNWEGDAPPGGILHIAAFDGSGLRVTDVWESTEAFHAFVDTRLMPSAGQLGIAGEPSVEIYPVHALFTPAFDIAL